MGSRPTWFVLGIIIAIVGGVVIGYFHLRAGFFSMATSAPPLPFEQRVTRVALRASYGLAADTPDPLPADDANLLAGAQLYVQHCAFCHGTPGSRASVARGMYPAPPQLFDSTEMVTDDPQGITFGKVTHGIRFSGMPAFRDAMSDTQRWQVTMLVTHADKLPPRAAAALRQ